MTLHHTEPEDTTVELGEAFTKFDNTCPNFFDEWTDLSRAQRRKMNRTMCKELYQASRVSPEIAGIRFSKVPT
jgi:hypothetical protein